MVPFSPAWMLCPSVHINKMYFLTGEHSTYTCPSLTPESISQARWKKEIALAKDFRISSSVSRELLHNPSAKPIINAVVTVIIAMPICVFLRSRILVPVQPDRWISFHIRGYISRRKYHPNQVVLQIKPGPDRMAEEGHHAFFTQLFYQLLC